MKRLVSVMVVLSVMLAMAGVSYAGEMVVEKRASIVAADFPNKSMSELKVVLLEKAKRAALSEIYGEVVRSESKVENFMLSYDVISSKALGIIRIKGTPRYYNGESFGEMCVSVEAFVTDEDLEKFRAKEVVIERFCFTDVDAPFARLRGLAREAAYLEVIKRHNPALSEIGVEDAKKVVHDFYLSGEKVDVDTGAYCMRVVAKVVPIEVEMLAGGIGKSDGPVVKKREVLGQGKKAKILLADEVLIDQETTKKKESFMTSILNYKCNSIKYNWTFKEYGGVGVTFDSVRVRVWAGYVGGVPNDKEKLKNHKLMFEKIYILEKPIVVPAMSVKTIEYKERKNVITSGIYSAWKFESKHSWSLLHEFIGQDSNGNEIIVEESTVK